MTRHGGEVEVIEGLARRQPGFGEMTLNATARVFGDLQFSKGGEESRRKQFSLSERTASSATSG
jgi:hypothetical protein